MGREILFAGNWVQDFMFIRWEYSNATVHLNRVLAESPVLKNHKSYFLYKKAALAEEAKVFNNHKMLNI